MIMPRLNKILAPFVLSTLLVVTACGTATQGSRRSSSPSSPLSSPPSSPEDIRPTPSIRPTTPASTPGEPLPGSTFNQFFPASGNGYRVVYTQEKKGFAQAKLKKSGKDVATLTISDTVSNPSARKKFEQSTEQVDGYPAVQQGRTGTAILVGDRFQVKVISRDSSFSESDRKTWLTKFNLRGLDQPRFDLTQQQSTQRGSQAVAREALPGSRFNKFFPRADSGYRVVYTQEKKGFAQAKLKKGGKDLATLTISDTVSNPSVRDKFEQSTEQISDYPAVQQGRTGTAVLVGDRFQVKVLSRDLNFSESDRQAWLAKFDLDGLARLK